MCDFQNCKCKTSLIGLCKYCHLNFCKIHRLQELHNCLELNTIKLNARNNLSKQLYESKVNNNKIIYI
jgi:predicted nucleic acid binding AN1-type Zn finger protein